MTSYFGPLPEGDKGLLRDQDWQWMEQQTISAQKIITGSLQAGQEVGSANYVAGSAGWQIDGDGNAEFNDVTVRGVLIAEGGSDVDWSFIKNVTVENADITSLSADKLTAGTIDASVITVENINADNITTGIIEALRYRTASSGTRLEIRGDTSDSFIRLYDSGNNQIASMGFIDPVASEVGISATGTNMDLVLDADDGRVFITAGNGAVQVEAVSFNSGNLSIPSFGGFDAGGNDLNNVRDVNASRFSKADEFVALSNGSTSDPPFCFNSDPDTGMYRQSTNILGWTTGGGLRARLWSSGFDLIAHPTTGLAANAHINTGSNNIVYRSTSSLKYKPDWEYADMDALARLDLPTPIIWSAKQSEEETDDVETDHMLGFGVEHLQEMLPEHVIQNQGDVYDPRSLIAILWAKVKRLEAQAGVA